MYVVINKNGKNVEKSKTTLAHIISYIIYLQYILDRYIIIIVVVATVVVAFIM